MTYRELVNICHDTDSCKKCGHRELCEVFKFDTHNYYPFQFYVLLYSGIDFDAEIEV